MSNRKIVTLSIAVALVFLLAQLVPYGREHTNPPEGTLASFDSPVTKDLAQRACFDCHSNRTRWPWYASVAPVSWRIQHHVAEGREKLNFSAFDPAIEKVADAAGEAGQSVTRREMPPVDYLVMHPEARLTLEGVASDGPLAPRTLVVDIGGGSTELVVAGDPEDETRLSTEAGSVRLTERFLHSDPPHGEELAACEAHVRSLLPRLAIDHAIGVAGTVATAAKIERAGALSVHGDRLSRERVGELLDRLAALPLAERERVHGLVSARAPVIVAGLVVLHEILVYYDIAELSVSERDLLDGVALAAAELPAPEEGPAPPGAYVCC